MGKFVPDYRHMVDAAGNMTPGRVPVYEHIISEKIMERILNREFAGLIHGDAKDKREYFRWYNNFFKEMGYDTVSFERCIGQAMPGSGALGRHLPGAVHSREDFEKYPWEEIPDIYFAKYSMDFRLMGEMLPQGMKAVGGPGNGVFEIVQDIVGYENLCVLSFEDLELYADLFRAVGEVMYRIWERFLEEFGDLYAVCRFGDDLGFKSATLISPADIKKHIVPRYKRIVDLVHSRNKPFLLHSCGRIFEVMPELIDVVGIDAKHSNEDQIAPFTAWVDLYGGRIGNFGGVDTDHLCRKSEQEIKSMVEAVMDYCRDKKGFALGSGNSIPDYVPVEGYLAMVEKAREFRGDYR